MSVLEYEKLLRAENDRLREQESPMKEEIDHPSHYHPGTYEAINVIEAWGLGFHLGNVVKYIARAGRKGSVVADLKKAQWYLDREIERLDKADREGR